MKVTKAFFASFDAIIALLIAFGFMVMITELLGLYEFDLSRIVVARVAGDVLTLMEEKSFGTAGIQQIFELSPFCHILEIYNSDASALIELHTKAGCQAPSEEQILWREFYDTRIGEFRLAKLISWR